MRASIALVVIGMPKIVSVRGRLYGFIFVVVNSSSRNCTVDTDHSENVCTGCKHDREDVSQSTFASSSSCALDTNLRKLLLLDHLIYVGSRMFAVYLRYLLHTCTYLVTSLCKSRARQLAPLLCIIE